MSGIISTNTVYNGQRATDRGTPIVNPGEDMDKDAFLKILSAQLQNLDPMGENDSTAYVTQMAQFTSMEQMSNLNGTMNEYVTQNLVGKGVTLRVTDKEGVPYTGIIKAVSTQNGKTNISVEVVEDGKNVFKEFTTDDILTVLDSSDNTTSGIINNINGNMQLLAASGFIGKYVELSEKNEDGNAIKGTVLGAIKDEGYVKVRIKIDGTDEIKEFTFDKVVKVSEKELGELTPEEDKEKPEEDKSESV